MYPLLTHAVYVDKTPNVLHIGGIFPIEGKGGWQGGQACKPAASLALNDVNKRKDLLPGFTLQLHWNDSEVIKRFFKMLKFHLLVRMVVYFEH